MKVDGHPSEDEDGAEEGGEAEGDAVGEVSFKLNWNSLDIS